MADFSIQAQAQDINFVGKFTPVEHFNTMDKGLADNPSTNT